MRISRIRIQNFRSIQTLDFPIGNICALIGPNNAGKSNILLALHHVLARDWVSVTTFEERMTSTDATLPRTSPSH